MLGIVRSFQVTLPKDVITVIALEVSLSQEGCHTDIYYVRRYCLYQNTLHILIILCY